MATRGVNEDDNPELSLIVTSLENDSLELDRIYEALVNAQEFDRELIKRSRDTLDGIQTGLQELETKTWFSDMIDSLGTTITDTITSAIPTPIATAIDTARDIQSGGTTAGQIVGKAIAPASALMMLLYGKRQWNKSKKWLKKTYDEEAVPIINKKRADPNSVFFNERRIQATE